MPDARRVPHRLARAVLAAGLVCLSACTTAPPRLGADRSAAPPSGVLAVCDARDATPAERDRVAAWQLAMNQKRIRAYRIDHDADADWLDRALRRPETDLRVRITPLHEALRRAPRSATPTIAAASVTNAAFFQSFKRRVPLAATIPYPNDPAAPAICWVWTGAGGGPLSPAAASSLLMRPAPAHTESLAVDPAAVLAHPVMADTLAAEVTVFRRRGLSLAAGTALPDPMASEYWRPLTALSPTGPSGALVLTRAGDGEAAPVAVIQAVDGETAASLAARVRRAADASPIPFVCCVADAGFVAPSIIPEMAAHLGPSWRWTTPDEIVHFAQRPELLAGGSWIEESTPFRLRVFESLHPALPMGVAVRWMGEAPPRWIDVRYREAHHPAAIQPLTASGEWSIALIPPLFEDGRLQYRFVAAEQDGRLVSSLPQSAAIARGDQDGDGLSNNAEFLIGSDPRNPDTDGDGLRDGDDPDPLRPDELVLRRWDFAELAAAAHGETVIEEGRIVLRHGEIVLPMPPALTAYGCRLRLLDAAGAWRVAAVSAPGRVELLHGRGPDDRRSPRERRECILGPAAGTALSIVIDRDPEIAGDPPSLSGLLLLAPAGDAAR